MKSILSLKALSILLPAVFVTPHYAVAIDYRLSGFARIVAGTLGDSNVEYSGYDDELKFDQDSLLGLQGQLLLSDKLSATALGIQHSNSRLDSGIEWLYLSYRPTKALNLKLGQMQSPFYSISDTLDVGYSYPWVIAPKEVYNDFVFKKFQGIDARYSHVAEGYSAHLEVYYGEFDDDISVNSGQVATNVEDLGGLIGEIRVDNLLLRASYHSGDVDLDLPATAQFAQLLADAGFSRSAASLATAGNAGFYQLSVDYESLAYFLKAEWIRIDLQGDFFPVIRSYYLTYGYYFGQFTALVTYGRQEDDLTPGVDEIPTGISPELDQLALGYQSIYENRAEDDITSWTLGLRWDFKANMAFKAEYKTLESDHALSSILDVDDGTQFDQRTSLFTMALEWIF